ncbi:hypothetical protein SDC9_107216 [bioreactor metagenome]|uniref:Response regulatory domain-containing protein n=1 Tax=bioreactor metagenome TaxID=1076179 RepID=A0A645B4M7_9ZZZZ
MEKGFMLIVDDIKNERKNLFQIFSDEFFIMESDNYIEALEIMRMHADVLSIVLFSASIMKSYDENIFYKINHEDSLKNIPIIAITKGKTDEGDKIADYVMDFIETPFKVDVVKAKVKSLCQNYCHEVQDNELLKNLSMLKCFSDMKIPYLVIKLDDRENPMIFYVNDVFRDAFLNSTDYVIGKSCSEVFPDYLDIINKCKYVAAGVQKNTENIEIKHSDMHYYSVNLYSPHLGYCL